jgi:hypothetical protein
VRRWLFRLFAACSLLLLCVAVCVVWARSYSAARIAFWVGPGYEWQAAASRGSVWVYWAKEPTTVPTNPPFGFHTGSYPGANEPRTWGYGPPNVPYVFDIAGLAVGHGPYAAVPGRQAGVVIAPCWMLCLLTAAAPLWGVWRWVRRRGRSEEGRCPACGYDLRATPDRCPECGRAAT